MILPSQTLPKLQARPPLTACIHITGIREVDTVIRAALTAIRFGGETMRYILNSAVITAPGHYTYAHITAAEAFSWLHEGGWISTVGYPETCEALQRISGIEIPCNRKQITMNVGDEALVFRLTKRLIVPENKGKVGVQEILENCEIGILKHVSNVKRGRLPAWKEDEAL